MHRIWIPTMALLLVVSACGHVSLDGADPSAAPAAPAETLVQPPPQADPPTTTPEPARAPAARRAEPGERLLAAIELFMRRGGRPSAIDGPSPARPEEPVAAPVEEQEPEPVSRPPDAVAYPYPTIDTRGRWTEFDVGGKVRPTVIGLGTDGAVWAAGNGGVIRFEGDGFEHYDLTGIDEWGGTLVSISPSPTGEIMVLAYADSSPHDVIGGRIYEFDGEAWIDHTPQLGFRTRQSGLWSSVAATGSDGVYRVAGLGMPDGTWLLEYDGTEWAYYPGPGPRWMFLWQGAWRKVAVSPRGEAWFADEGSFIRLTAEGGTRYAAPGPIGSPCCKYWVTVAPDGGMWGHAGEGISHFDGETWTHYTVADGLAGLVDTHHDAMGIPTQDGRVWISEWRAVSRFEDGRWASHGRREPQAAGVPQPLLPEGMKSDSAVVQGPDGSTWVIDPRGNVHRYDGTGWSKITVDVSLLPSSPRQIVIDGRGSAWFVTMDGIARFTPAGRDGASGQVP